jgi:YtkA-like
MRWRVYDLCFIAVAGISVFGLRCGGTDTVGSPTTSFPPDPYAVLTSQTGKLTIEVRTGPSQPPGRGNVDVQFVIRNEDGALVDGLVIQATPWMPVMGHGTSVEPEAVGEGDGKYVVRNVSLFMPGRWVLRTTFSGVATDEVTPTFDVR